MIRLLRLAAVAALVIVGAVAALVRVPWHALTAWDARTDAHVHTTVLDTHWLLDAAMWFTHVGDPAVVTAATFVLAALLARRHGRVAVYLLVVRAVAVGLESAVKLAVGRHRPVLPHPVAHASGFSFPSGHATGSAALWGSVAVAVWVVVRRLVVVALAVIVPAAVAATRVLLGVHFVTDVVAGVLVGWAVAAGLARFAIGASPRTAGRASPSMARDRAR